MGKGWKKSNGNSAAGREFTVNSVVSKKVLWASLETRFDAIAVIAADADHFQEAVLGAVGVAGVVDLADEDTNEPGALVEIAEKKRSGISGELARRWLHHEWRAEEG